MGVYEPANFFVLKKRKLDIVISKQDKMNVTNNKKLQVGGWRGGGVVVCNHKRGKQGQEVTTENINRPNCKNMETILHRMTTIRNG